MDALRLEHELAEALRRLGVDVRVEPMTPAVAARRGGLCTLRGRRLVLVDSGSPALDRAVVLAGALARLDHDLVFLTPAARALVVGQLPARRDAAPLERPPPRSPRKAVR